MSQRSCVALLSGGLDSMLAIRMMQEQNIAVEALNFKTIFTCCQDLASESARDLGVRVTVVGQEDDYLDLLRKPRFGYGKGANPCVDCRIYMFRRAKVFMDQIGADFLVSGEVVGQRPMSQKKKDLNTISFHSELEEILLRPLSAKLLPPTLPEREGWVDRDRLGDFQGRSRKGLIELARRYGIEDIPTPSTGCSLTEPTFSRKVFDLLKSPTIGQRWDFELLKFGRHFRLDAHTKVVVGRDDADNNQLLYLHELPEASSTGCLFPENFNGPRVLIVGPLTEQAIRFANGLVVRYAKRHDDPTAMIRFDDRQETRFIPAAAEQQAETAETVTS